MTSNSDRRVVTSLTSSPAGWGDGLAMHYLRLTRTRWIIGSFVLFVILALTFPSIDLQFSRLFFHGKSFSGGQRQQQFLHDGLNIFLAVSLLAVTALYAINRIWRRNLLGIDGRKVVYLLLVLIIGAGLIVNVGLKDNVGRARPRNVTEFGGTKHFTPAFVVSRECDKNCSFSSGDAAGGFFSLALAMALTRRRSAIAAAVAIGVVFSIGRVSAGAHFLSDTVMSFFVMLIVADLLHHFMLSDRAWVPMRPRIGGALEPALVAAPISPAADPGRPEGLH